MTPYREGQEAYRNHDYHNPYDAEDQPVECGEWVRGWQDEWLKED